MHAVSLALQMYSHAVSLALQMYSHAVSLALQMCRLIASDRLKKRLKSVRK